MNTFTKIDRLLSLSFFYGFIAFSAHLWIPVMTNEAEVGTYTIYSSKLLRGNGSMMVENSAK